MMNKNKLLVYIQPTFNNEEAVLGGSTPSRIVTVLKPYS